MSKFTSVILRQRTVEEKIKITVTAFNEEAAEARIAAIARSYPEQGESEDCSCIRVLSTEHLDVTAVTSLSFAEEPKSKNENR